MLSNKLRGRDEALAAPALEATETAKRLLYKTDGRIIAVHPFFYLERCLPYNPGRPFSLFPAWYLCRDSGTRQIWIDSCGRKSGAHGTAVSPSKYVILNNPAYSIRIPEKAPLF